MNWICSHCGEKFSRYRTRCPSDGQRVIEDLTGQLIGGRYRVRELIGVGGMDSTVWKAWQTGTERVVAVKVLPAAEEAAARRFARGARIAANLNHPNCTVVHDYGRSEDGKLFLVMEFLSGQVLQAILGPEGMSVADTLHVADQVLQALEHAHSQRAVHRDLKPDNLFLCRKNDDPLHVKILDFGIAKYVEEDPENTASSEDGQTDAEGFEDLVTEQRQVCGTPQYMAPEQVVGARIDGRTDLYSLGCVMYRMLTGRLPFDGKTRYELYQKHLQEAPRPFSEIRPDLVFPDRLELIVMKALAKRADQRFQSASEMRKALETVELPEDRARRSNRPRVSLKHTSPQERGPMPTVLPGPLWTLSPQASPHVAAGLMAPGADGAAMPPPLPGGRSLEAGVTVLPSGFLGANDPNPLIEVDPSLLGKRPNPQSLPQAPAAVGPSLPAAASKPPRAKGGASTGLLSDAVLRHPVSRSSLALAPEVPRSSETEPNKLGDEGEAKKRRLTVFAVLAGAFLVGVGGVALVMKLTRPVEPTVATSGGEGGVVGEKPQPGAPSDGVVRPAIPGPSGPVGLVEGGERAAGQTVATEGKPEAGRESARPVGAPDEQVAAGAMGATAAGAAPAPGTVDPVGADGQAPGEVGTAGEALGAALGGASLHPGLELVTLTSNPPGALVRALEGPGATRAGEADPSRRTPITLALAPGTHRFGLELDGFLPQTLEVTVDASPRSTGRHLQPQPVALARRPVAPAPGVRPPQAPQTLQRTTPPSPTPQNAAPAPRPPIGATPGTQPASGETPRAPTTPTTPNVRLLDDAPGSPNPPGGPKKPAVKLLEDDPAPAKKPQVKVLED